MGDMADTQLEQGDQEQGDQVCEMCGAFGWDCQCGAVCSICRHIIGWDCTCDEIPPNGDDIS